MEVLAVVVIIAATWFLAFLFGHLSGHDRGYHEGYTDRDVGLPRMYQRIWRHKRALEELGQRR